MAKRTASSKPKTTRTSSRTGSTRRSSSRSRQSAPPPKLIRLSTDQKLDLVGVGLVFVALFTILSLLSAQQGSLTALWLSLLSNLFGWGMYIVPLFIGAVGLWLLLRRFGERIPWPEPEQVVGIVLGFFVALTTIHLILHFIHPQEDLYTLARERQGGGYLGALLTALGLQAIGEIGLSLALVLLWLVVITFSAGLSPADVFRLLTGLSRSEDAALLPEAEEAAPPLVMSAPPSTPAPPKAAVTPTESLQPTPPSRAKKGSDEPIIRTAGRVNGSGGASLDIPAPTAGGQAWPMPQVSKILEPGSEQDFSQDIIRKQARIIEETLASLGAPVKVKEINRGPVVTQFGLEPLFITTRNGKQTKVKVSRIVSLADDVALALSAPRIRTEAPVPGKGLVGLEVPNAEPTVVALRDVMETEAFSRLKGSLRLALGQDVSGQAVCADMRAMPHLLIAGTTGSGKSVCVNAIIAGFLLQNTPDTLRLILIDPKRVELTQYNGIPHLLTPVIVDVERVVPALRWVMREMDARYRRFASIGARHLEDYNERVQKQQGDEKPLPYIVVVIDELADVMLQAPEETERVLCRLAQMARATGIHLIVATQRPSVDVVTGLIKANFPARIAFAVASSVDSRVILDTPGAERLLGRGDMLFVPPDAAQPIRIQGAFVSDAELQRLIHHWRQAATAAEYPVNVVSIPAPVELHQVEQPPLFPELEKPQVPGFEFEDELLPTAVEILLAEDRASISLLQRRLRIGYTRSARLMDMLLEMGIVTPEVTENQFRGVNRSAAQAFLDALHRAAGDTQTSH